MSLTQPHAFSPNLIFSESGGNKWKGVCVCVKTRPCFLSGDECKEISLLNRLWLCLSNRKIMIRLDEITTLVSTRLISEARGPVIQSIMLGTWPRDKRMKREYDVCGGPIWSNCLQHKSYSVYQNILPTFLNNFATILQGGWEEEWMDFLKKLDKIILSTTPSCELSPDTSLRIAGCSPPWYQLTWPSPDPSPSIRSSHPARAVLGDKTRPHTFIIWTLSFHYLWINFPLKKTQNRILGCVPFPALSTSYRHQVLFLKTQNKVWLKWEKRALLSFNGYK